MQRRGLLKLGLASAALLAVAGYGVSRMGPGLAQGRLTAAGRVIMKAVTQAQLAALLPAAADARALAIEGAMDRLEQLIAGLSQHAQAELSTLLGLMAHPAGRWGMCGLQEDWAVAPVAAVQAALQGMRHSGLDLKVQAYQGLHDLVGAAHFADAGSWRLMGYPGPRAL